MFESIALFMLIYLIIGAVIYGLVILPDPQYGFNSGLLVFCSITWLPVLILAIIDIVRGV